MNLNNMPMPAKRSNSCDLKQIPDITMGNTAVKTVSLFEQKRLRGFWPVYNEVNGQRELTVSHLHLFNSYFELSKLSKLFEAVQMRGHNIRFYAELTKIIPNYYQIHVLPHI